MSTGKKVAPPKLPKPPRPADEDDEDIKEIESALVEISDDEEDRQHLVRNQQRGRQQERFTQKKTTWGIAPYLRIVLICLGVIGAIYVTSTWLSGGSNSTTGTRPRRIRREQATEQIKEYRTESETPAPVITTDETGVTTDNATPCPTLDCTKCAPDSSPTEASTNTCPPCAATNNVAPTVATTTDGSVATSGGLPAGATFIVGTPPQTTNFLSDEISQFRAEAAALNSGRLNILARWEDPVSYKAIMQSESKWTALDEEIEKITSQPVAYDTDEKKNRLKFDPKKFRQMNIPILWGDSTAPNDVHNFAHVHWNAAAEKKFYELIKQQQFPSPPVDCTKAKFILLEQWGAGFFSRFNVAIEQIARAMNNRDRQVILTFAPMGVGGSYIQSRARDDYAGEGMLQYFQPWAQCQNHPHVLRMIRHGRTGGPEGFSQISREGAPIVHSWDEIQPGGKYFDTQFVHICDDWCASHRSTGHDGPLRRLIFDPRVWAPERTKEWREKEMWREGNNHDMEHIYAIDQEGLTPDDNQWRGTHEQRWKMWQEFFEIQASAFFFRPNARLHMMRSLISDFWRTQMLRQQNIYPSEEVLAPSEPNALDNSAGIFMRRGDKCPDDTYCTRHGRYRGFGLFAHGVYREEQRRGRPFSSIFIMTDDGPAFADLLRQLQEEGPIGNVKDVFKVTPQSTQEEIEAAIRTGDDMTVAKAILKGRWVTHNSLAPAACFDPANRQGFEAFLTSLQYLIHHNAFIVGHESSNVMYFMARIMFLKNQFNENIVRMGPGAHTQDVRDDFN